MYHLNEKYAATPSNISQGRSPLSPRESRPRSWRCTPRKLFLAVNIIASSILVISLVSTFYHPAVSLRPIFPSCGALLITSSQHHRPSYLTGTIPYNATLLPNAAFQPPEPLPRRVPDTIDTFIGHKYRNTCNISSLDLHAAFAPLCPDRTSLLTALSSGGRIGHDAPYMPRGCDMRWFTTEEICEILSRFEKVVIVGDSMMRHVMGSINVLIRKDLGYGAVTDWNFSPEER